MHINGSISNNSLWYKCTVFFAFFFLHTVKIILCQAIQFNIVKQIISFWPIDRTLSGATIPGWNGPRSDGNKRGIPHSAKLLHYWSFSIRLFSVIPGYSLEESYPSSDMQSVYSAALLADCTIMSNEKLQWHGQSIILESICVHDIFRLMTYQNFMGYSMPKTSMKKKAEVLFNQKLGDKIYFPLFNVR